MVYISVCLTQLHITNFPAGPLSAASISLNTKEDSYYKRMRIKKLDPNNLKSKKFPHLGNLELTKTNGHLGI